MLHNVYKAITIGGSAGSLDVLLDIVSHLPQEVNLPIIIICHLHPHDDGSMVEIFSRQTVLTVNEAADKEQVRPGHIYFPPANYHLLVEMDKTFSLSIDAKVNYSRPSIDVFFESAAVAWGPELIGILLTGANNDGAEGIRTIKQYGGLTIAQDLQEAAYPTMPGAAINTGHVDKVLTVAEINSFLHHLLNNTQSK
ncbi:chemotaxis protein CheB [Desulforhopalus sp. IMCC35007]|uniref:chemotaxis protein CheB n=1 Tax=Desulforhopalus sp. IMCC35007 TaxID=2569543 RepID=UPI0010AED969|nr:chemotaxis protein CheB [Desulforhopalus sp. IMCC35007]TKB10409.1 chemotaxis protein CheB [Desulforhopalus sp. IMCC35007]